MLIVARNKKAKIIRKSIFCFLYFFSITKYETAHVKTTRKKHTYSHKGRVNVVGLWMVISLVPSEQIIKPKQIPKTKNRSLHLSFNDDIKAFIRIRHYYIPAPVFSIEHFSLVVKLNYELYK